MSYFLNLILFTTWILRICSYFKVVHYSCFRTYFHLTVYRSGQSRSCAESTKLHVLNGWNSTLGQIWAYSICVAEHFDTRYRPKRSWGKVIFSEACVKNSVHGGGGACMAGGMRGRGMHGGGACMVGGGMHGRRACVVGGHACQGVCMTHMPPPSPQADTMRYSQWAGRTHPTGMHSRLICIKTEPKCKFYWQESIPIACVPPACQPYVLQ